MGDIAGVVNGDLRRRAHVLMIPFEEQGHYTVFLQLLYYLSSLDVTVTFCSNERRITQLLELKRKGEFRGLDLRHMQLSDEVSKPSHAPGALPPLWELAKSMKFQFQPHREKLAGEKNPDARPTILIADSLLDWTEEFASDLQIPRYLLFTTAGWIPYVILKTRIEGWNKSGDDIVDIPGHANVRASEVPSILFPLVNLRNVAGILVNTFEELEADGADATRSYLEQATTDHDVGKNLRYFPIGPMVHLPGYPGARDGHGSEVLQWLDKQSSSSVLYIAFGTMANVPKSLLLELARGLEISNVPFLWVIRLPVSTDDVTTLLPPGFQARTKGRGIVETAFAPQLQILRHSATGGFMSHCGWNSSIESISSGVPLLTWPMHGDQHVNARLIVEVAKVGLRVQKEGNCNHVIDGEDVAASVRSLMVDDEGKEVKRNAARIKELAWASMEEGGSSLRRLREFTRDILAL